MLLEGAYCPRATVLPHYLHRPVTNNINMEVSFSESKQSFLQHMFPSPLTSCVFICPDKVLQMCQTSRKYSPWTKQAVVLLVPKHPLMQTA